MAIKMGNISIEIKDMQEALNEITAKSKAARQRLEIIRSLHERCMQTQAEDLAKERKPARCPFCSFHNIMNVATPGCPVEYYCRCASCLATGPTRNTPEEARAAWGKRAEER